MKKVLLSSIFLSMGIIGLATCGQDFNSNSFDGGTQVFDCSAEADPTECESLNILSAKCINCHTGQHSSWAAYTTANDYITSGRITAGSADASTLITKLNLHSPPGNMPPTGSTQLTVSEYDTLVLWVEGL